MLALITSLRHPGNSNDYSTVGDIFLRSLTAWVRQDDPRFFVVVVGNERPRFPLPPSVRFVQVGFPPPSTHRGPRTGTPAVLRDKGTKLAVGLLAAREREELTHVMFVDSDDFISRRLARFVADHSDEPGWTVTHGWRYNPERRALRPHDGDFYLQCGSSHIVREDLYPQVELPITASQSALYDGFGDRLERWFGSHMYVRDDLGLADLPFPGALYRVGSGEAHSGNSMGSWGRPIASSIADEFGVPATGIVPWRMLRAVLPSAEAFTRRVERMTRRGRREKVR